ncbi:phosphotransferase [Nocardioides sp. zg-1228]|uniref:phosphotransferase n=1 Tax=Nocardioides sp. zg-1228 TaxID=2763008 RepID=UPI001642A6A0|nr:phosphotransferase [Nocardioides sp. zg-1228]MBC2934981.1 phosphotransferase [Nocardioides sp. zg-1228]QSF56156.1 phosphotransferase [Nocardioides sp. zg-1228]
MDGSTAAVWQPEPGWQRLSGAGPATVGLWAATHRGREVVVKRLGRPDPHDAPGVLVPADVNYWRRAADVALSGVVADSPGLREAPVVRVEEDEEGITLVHERVATADPPGLWLAACLGRFAAVDLGGHAWLARDQLRSRLRLVERRGGWRTLARTPVADIADHLWARRTSWLDRCDALPQVAQHGDPSAGNIPGRDGDGAVAIDWAHLGRGPVGADLGYLSLATREDIDPLVEAYVDALPPGLASRADVVTGARVMAVYTALTRLDWALARVADGEGALAGKFRHPSVAPYIHSMQRQVAQIEALLDDR